MATYYVRKDGSNANTGTANDAAHAWLTIQHAADTMVAGDTTFVTDGTYTENINQTKAGTSGSRITFRSLNKWGAKIVGTSTVVFNIGTDGNLPQGQYVDVIGFDVTGDANNSWLGICSRTSNVRIYDCFVHDMPAVLSAPPNSNNGGAGIDVFNGTAGATSCVIERNVVERIGQGYNQIVHGIYLAQLNVTCRNNLSNNNSGWGITSYHTTDALIVCNNVCFKNGAGGILIANDGGGSPATVRNSKCNNNICINNGGYPTSCWGISEQNGASTNVYQNNCCYNNQDGNFNIPNGTAPVNTITSDAQFLAYLDDGTGDYQITAGSPCRDAGTSNGAPPDDYNSVARPVNAIYDIGMFEFVPPPGVGAGVLIFNKQNSLGLSLIRAAI